MKIKKLSHLTRVMCALMMVLSYTDPALALQSANHVCKDESAWQEQPDGGGCTGDLTCSVACTVVYFTSVGGGAGGSHVSCYNCRPQPNINCNMLPQSTLVDTYTLSGGCAFVDHHVDEITTSVCDCVTSGGPVGPPVTRSCTC